MTGEEKGILRAVEAWARCIEAVSEAEDKEVGVDEAADQLGNAEATLYRAVILWRRAKERS